MGNTGQTHAKEEAPPAKQDEQDKPGSSHISEGLGKLYVPGLEAFKKKSSSSCCRTCLKIMFVCLAILTILKSIAVIAVAVTTAIATKIYSSDQSGRLVALIILAVTAAVTISISIYAITAVCRQNKSLHASCALVGGVTAICLSEASVVLIILSIMQAVIVGVSVRVTPEDEVNLGRSLSESFRLAREDNPRHVKIWTTTQHDLNCCGVYSAEDYRTARIPQYFPPDVPISCCPSYDPDRSELVQERAREMCKAKKEFYDIGCRSLVVEVFKETATMLLSVSIALIVLEVILSILSAVMCKKKNEKLTNPEEGVQPQNKNKS